MSVQTTTLYKVLDQSENSIFFDKPGKIQINEKAVTCYATSSKIEVLIEELKEKGPLVALGKIGPAVYVDAPFKLSNKVGNHDIYGWKPGVARKDSSKQSHLLILGAKKVDDRECVYFTLSQDLTLDSTSYIRQHKPATTDTKIYAVSHNTFSNYLCDLYPPVQPSEKANDSSVFSISSKPENTPKLSPLEREYAETTASIMPLNSILDRGIGESNCKAIGQKAFDEFKKQANGNSWAAREAVQKICNSMLSLAQDGSLRKQYIEHAWNGIGDENWRWMA